MIPIVLTVVRVMLVVTIMMIIRVMMMSRVREWGRERRTSVAWCSSATTYMHTHNEKVGKRFPTQPIGRMILVWSCEIGIVDH